MANRLSRSAVWAVLLVGALLVGACARGAPPSAPAESAGSPPGAQAPAASQPAARASAAPSAGAPIDERAVESFYRGRTFKIVVGFSPGGGFDTYARLVARKLGDYIPGRPTVVVENMPGAGSLRAAQYVANLAPRNGAEMVVFIQGLILSARVGQQGVDFDPRALTWIGNPLPENTVCAIRNDSGFTTFQQAAQSGRTLQFGAAGTGGESWYVPKILEAGGAGKWNIISGYDGSSKVKLAVEQGEVEGVCTTGMLQGSPYWFEGDSAIARLVLQSGKTRSPEAPNVPTWRELGLDASLAPILDTAEALETIGRPFAMPPGVPADRVAAIRRAWLEAWKDPDVLAAAAQARFEVNAQGHEPVEAGVRTIMALPESQVQQIKDIFALN